MSSYSFMLYVTFLVTRRREVTGASSSSLDDEDDDDDEPRKTNFIFKFRFRIRIPAYMVRFSGHDLNNRDFVQCSDRKLNNTILVKSDYLNVGQNLWYSDVWFQVVTLIQKTDSGDLKSDHLKSGNTWNLDFLKVG